MVAKIPIDNDAITAFCRKWKVRELSLFGSVLRDDFKPESDVDVLVVFEPEAPWSLWDWPDMMDELQAMFGHPVDLVEKAGLRNPFLRHEILNTRKQIYVAPQ
ncbi:MAG: DNA polymerase subunit beta [Planctomycetes bacterium]|nr:DNA polymerase subunit beta [Planctomycetota bacterium]